MKERLQPTRYRDALILIDEQSEQPKELGEPETLDWIAKDNAVRVLRQ